MPTAVRIIRTHQVKEGTLGRTACFPARSSIAFTAAVLGRDEDGRPEWNRRMLDLSLRAGFEMRLCRPYPGPDQGLGESGVNPADAVEPVTQIQPRAALEPASGLRTTTLTPTEPYQGSSSETATAPITEPIPEPALEEPTPDPISEPTTGTLEDL